MGNSYKLSTGEYIKKSLIDLRIREAKKIVIDNQIDEYGYNFCEVCKASSGVRLDCSHYVSVDECQKTGRSELAYDVNNIQVLCRECHKERDNNQLKFNVSEN